MDNNQLQSQLLRQMMSSMQQGGVGGLTGTPLRPPQINPAATGRAVMPQGQGATGQPAGVPATGAPTAGAPQLDSIALAKRAYLNRQKQQAMQRQQTAGVPAGYSGNSQSRQGGNPWASMMQKPQQPRNGGASNAAGGGAFNGKSPLG